MKIYVIVLLLLKASMIVQFILVSAKIESADSLAYLISDTLFKSILGTFLFTFFAINGSSNFDSWDEVFISFGGVLLIFDAVYTSFPKVLRKFNIYFNPYTFYLSNRPENGATVSQ